MITIGGMNDLAICEITDKGCFVDADSQKLFIPRSQMKEDSALGSILSVFLYYDDGRLTATARRPKALMGELASLKVTGSSRYGYFLDNSIRKDVFLPLDEVKGPLDIDQEVIVYLYLDHENRMCATQRYTRHFSDVLVGQYQINDIVKVLPIAITDIGVKAVVENSFYAMFLKNEDHRVLKLKLGKKVYAQIRRIRDDRKVDLVLASDSRTADHTAVSAGSAAVSSDPKPAFTRGASFHQDEELMKAIVDKLTVNNGYLPFTDKTAPNVIEKVFHVSKGKFKKAIGNLYRQKKISLEADGIHLLQ